MSKLATKIIHCAWILKNIMIIPTDIVVVITSMYKNVYKYIKSGKILENIKNGKLRISLSGFNKKYRIIINQPTKIKIFNTVDYFLQRNGIVPKYKIISRDGFDIIHVNREIFVWFKNSGFPVSIPLNIYIQKVKYANDSIVFLISGNVIYYFNISDVWKFGIDGNKNVQL